MVDGAGEHLDEEVGVVLMVDGLQFGGDQLPVVGGVEEGHEGVEVEIADDHIVDAFGLDAAVGAGQAYLAHLFQHMEVFLVQHVFVEQERHMGVAEAVPYGRGHGLGDESAKHEGARLEAGEVLRYAAVGGHPQEFGLVGRGEEVEHARLVLV